jgi:uncharacterized membrane protein
MPSTAVRPHAHAIRERLRVAEPVARRFPIEIVARVYFASLLTLTMAIGLEHFFVPTAQRVPLLEAVAGHEYASAELPAFAAHPSLMAWHGVSGLIFVAIAPVQLWTRFRRRHRTLHRMLGTVCLAMAVLSAFTGVAVAAAVRFSGPSEPVPNVVVSFLIVCFAACAVWNALRRDFAAHREWMLRVVALGVGIGLARVYLFLLVHGVGLPPRDALGEALWLGSGTNLVLTEIWINVSRRVRRARV